MLTGTFRAGFLDPNQCQGESATGPADLPFHPTNPPLQVRFRPDAAVRLWRLARLTTTRSLTTQFQGSTAIADRRCSDSQGKAFQVRASTPRPAAPRAPAGAAAARRGPRADHGGRLAGRERPRHREPRFRSRFERDRASTSIPTPTGSPGGASAIRAASNRGQGDGQATDLQAPPHFRDHRGQCSWRLLRLPDRCAVGDANPTVRKPVQCAGPGPRAARAGRPGD